MEWKYKVHWGPGYRYFTCDECGHKWREKSRDWTSFSVSICPEFEKGVDHVFGIGQYKGGEPHYEWEVNEYGTPV